MLMLSEYVHKIQKIFLTFLNRFQIQLKIIKHIILNSVYFNIHLNN